MPKTKPNGTRICHALAMALSNKSETHVLAARLDESGGLVAATKEEDIWAWNNGEKWGNELPNVPDDR